MSWQPIETAPETKNIALALLLAGVNAVALWALLSLGRTEPLPVVGYPTGTACWASVAPALAPSVSLAAGGVARMCYQP